MRNKIIFNGLYLTQSKYGVQRYAREIMRNIDSLTEDDDRYYVYSPKMDGLKVYNNIKQNQVGKLTGLMWEQIDLCFAAKNNYVVNFCNTLPMFHHKNIITIHDISYKVNNSFFNKSLRNIASMYWHRCNYSQAFKNPENIIVTVSEFSKNEIVDAYKVSPDRIHVIPNGWQHMDRIDSDIDIIKKYDLINKKYYYSISSLAFNKNIPWILNQAKLESDVNFIIAGTSPTKEQFNHIPDNVKFIGKVSDSESKALMTNCDAFIFPTYYEGFGIPPLEALSCGAKIIVSDIPCMHEIYEDSAYYINPNYNNELISDIIHSKVSSQVDILNKYNWFDSAKLWLDLVNTI